MGQWQKESAKYALGIFVIFVVTILLAHLYLFHKLNVVAETVGVPFLLGFLFILLFSLYFHF